MRLVDAQNKIWEDIEQAEAISKYWDVQDGKKPCIQLFYVGDEDMVDVSHAKPQPMPVFTPSLIDACCAKRYDALVCHMSFTCYIYVTHSSAIHYNSEFHFSFV